MRNALSREAKVFFDDGVPVTLAHWRSQEPSGGEEKTTFGCMRRRVIRGRHAEQRSLLNCGVRVHAETHSDV